MAYSLYVSGAQQFLPVFYRRLFEEGDAAKATRGGRQQMYANAGRVCARGKYDLQDWLVPVVYQQAPMSFSFAEKGQQGESERVALPEEASDRENPYGFVGRDGALLQMERAMHRPPAGILVHGLGGAGKTTLARGFVHWLAQTDGLGQGCFWFAFDEIRSAEFVINRMGEALFDAEFIPLSMVEKLARLAPTLREHRYVVVWDNFESACGIEGTPVSALLSGDDQQILRRFLQALRGGKSNVIITSRSEEDWLGVQNRFKVSIGGLQAEERWEYCEVILRDLGITIDRTDPQLVELMGALDGHPLMMRVILPKLEDRTAAQILEALRTNLLELGLAGDATQDKLTATLRFVEQGLPEELRPLLVPLSLHERFVDANHLEAMADAVGSTLGRAQIDRFLGALALAGLVDDRGRSTYGLHPALSSFLRTRANEGDQVDHDGWARAFVDVMERVARALAVRPLRDQRVDFHFHGGNIWSALPEAERLSMDDPVDALLRCLAGYALNARDLAGAETLYQRLAQFVGNRGWDDRQAAAYHSLGIVAEERREFVAAEAAYRNALAIAEKFGNEAGAASTYHHLGRIAEERRDFDVSEEWYRKSLAIKQKLGNDCGSATSYGQLGILSQKRGDIDAAVAWYRKALTIFENLGDEQGMASTYHQLGMVDQDRLEPAAAETWYRKALAIEEKIGDEHGAAITSHQVGRLAEQRRDFDAAEAWYRKSVAIKERIGDEHAASITYHQFGNVALERRDLDAAEAWYQKSVAIKERFGDVHGAAHTYTQLGIVAAEQGRFRQAGMWLVKSIVAFERANDHDRAQSNAHNFMYAYLKAPAAEQEQLEVIWMEAGLGSLPMPR